RSPVDPASQLQAVPTEGLPPRAAAVLNQNAARLNALLYGPQQDLLIARRGTASPSSRPPHPRPPASPTTRSTCCRCWLRATRSTSSTTRPPPSVIACRRGGAWTILRRLRR